MSTSPRLIAAVALASALAGCAAWELGPEPDNYVGPGQRSGDIALTDSTLQAVRPVVPGDLPGGAAVLPGAEMPSTLPAATQPVTSGPATAGAGLRPESQPGVGKSETPTPVPDSLSVQDAILVALQNNTSLRIQKYSVPLSRTAEERARAVFDPTISGSLQGGANAGASGNTSNSIGGSIGASQFLPTGTTIEGSLSNSNNFYSDASSSLGATLSVTQALLRGAGLEVNLASLRSAELSTKISQYELRGFAESLVADIELTYWDLAYAERQVVIVQNAFDVAQKQFTDTTERIRIGTLSASERPAAEAELALRRENLINARYSLETTRMRLMQLLTPASREFWTRTVTLTTLPFVPTGNTDPVDKHVEVALQLRPEINQTKLQIQRGDLELVQTRNGLLPRLDLFVTLGKTGFASSFGESITGLNGPGYQAVVGVRGDWSPINRSARASYRASELSRQQLDDSFDNLVQSIQLDVRTQYIEVERTRQQIDASKATRVAQEEKFSVETKRLATGAGKSLDVAIAHRDLLVAQLSEVQSVTNHLKALVNLYRLEGSLLFRRGLDAPGNTPAAAPPWRK